ncbi:GDSL-type esterase/lipase family protein [Pedobacter sp.]|uniref:GDSL-type esterase/lipase family protein n=1 Tax=Pedobacter sp. TaxID=1411316 RepID=UPI003BABA6E0
MNKIATLKVGLLANILLAVFAFKQQDKPTLYLVGDSTVAGGWGKFVHQYFDTTKVSVQNCAVSGTSSRTYYTSISHDEALRKKGMWRVLKAKLKPGDVVLIQFGHNDDGPIDDLQRSRGSLKGNGEDTVSIINHFSGEREIVHSYGWYLARFISEAKAKGATAVICSPIPKDQWKDGKIQRVSEGYGKWARTAAERNNAPFLDLNSTLADIYDKEGAKATARYFTEDHVHPSTQGGMLGAQAVINYIGSNQTLNIRPYLKP